MSDAKLRNLIRLRDRMKTRWPWLENLPSGDPKHELVFSISATVVRIDGSEPEHIPDSGRLGDPELCQLLADATASQVSNILRIAWNRLKHDIETERELEIQRIREI